MKGLYTDVERERDGPPRRSPRYPGKPAPMQFTFEWGKEPGTKRIFWTHKLSTLICPVPYRDDTQVETRWGYARKLARGTLLGKLLLRTFKRRRKIQKGNQRETRE